MMINFKEIEEFGENGIYEPELKSCFHRIIEDNINVFVDVGANVGLYTRIFAESRKDKAKIYMFEPEPIRYDYLKEKIKIWQRRYGSKIKVFKVAISDFRNEKMFYAPKDRKASGALNKTFVERLKRPLDSFIVKTNTLDNCFGNTKIDLIKMDIEGEEVKALRGASELLKMQNPIIMIESHMQLHNEICTIMTDLGYEIYGLNKGQFTCWKKRE